MLIRPSPPVIALRASAAALLALTVLASGIRAQEAADPGYAVLPGDQVSIAVFSAAGEPIPQVGGDRIVDRNGRLYLPLLGTLEVAGLDAAGIREFLVDRFSELYASPVVDVTVRLRVNVTGAVRAPGHYFLDPSSTVVDALAVAGGTGTEVQIGSAIPAADASQIRLVRGGRQIILDLRPEHADRETVGFHVHSGDWIYVPPRTRSRIRDNLGFVSSILTVVASAVGIVVLLTR